MKSILITLTTAAALTLSAGPGAQAQSSNQFAAAVRVNDGAVTNFEVSQRVLLLRAFGTAGNLQELAVEQLIDDRLRVQAARAAGLSVTEEEVDTGIDEFAQRGNLTGPQLLQFIRQRGVDPESMKDFVRAGLLWRTLVQARFGPRSAVSEAEIDTTLDLQAGQEPLELLISEIRIPATPGRESAAQDLAERLSNSISSEGAFAAAARRHSRAPSRARSGRLDWLPVATLPPQLVGQLLALNPGEVTAPIPLGPTIGLFQLRGTRAARSRDGQTPVSVTYVTVDIPFEPGDRALREANELVNDVDTCDDLRAQSERWGTIPGHTDFVEDITALPGSVALLLADLDRHEAAVYTNSAGGPSVIMLCQRLRDLPEGARDNIRNALFQQRISGFGQGYLQELKGDANIIRTN
ncbi:MAG: peptidylprolyl isomerase [Pseudomonadota bacterium]